MLLNHLSNGGMIRATLVTADRRLAFDLSGTDTFIGRARENQISIASDLSLSRRHAAITKIDGVYYLRDLRSSNGTLLNGKSVTGTVVLQPNDEIFLGKTRFQFLLTCEEKSALESHVSTEGTTILSAAKTLFATNVRNLMHQI
ncbi:hypothetical protein BH10CYA1_BH10CYA1_36270 [soil metagenome]